MAEFSKQMLLGEAFLKVPENAENSTDDGYWARVFITQANPSGLEWRSL
jgi:hypothetical protein